MDKIKKAGKGVVDAGAKTMLKVRNAKHWRADGRESGLPKKDRQTRKARQMPSPPPISLLLVKGKLASSVGVGSAAYAAASVGDTYIV